MLRLEFALALIAVLAAPCSFAQDPAPDAVIRAVTMDVIAAVRLDREVQAGNPAIVADLVETRIMPMFDFDRMTQSAMARNWKFTTPLQRAQLTAEFRTLLVRTYSTALSSYRDQGIEFKPLRAAPRDTEVTVKSVIRQSGTAQLSLDYDLEKTPAGWKVFDVKIEGVSLVATYRETFAAVIRENGVDALIKSLLEKNRQNGPGMRPDGQLGPVIVRTMLQFGR